MSGRFKKQNKGRTSRDGKSPFKGDSKLRKALILPQAPRVAKETMEELASNTARTRREIAAGKVIEKARGNYFFSNLDRENLRIRADRILKGIISAKTGDSYMTADEFLREIVLFIAETSERLELGVYTVDDVDSEIKRRIRARMERGSLC